MSCYTQDGTPPTLPARKREAARQQLELLVARSARGRRWRRPSFIVVATTVIVLGTTAAVTLMHDQAITNTTEARCYTVASTAGDDHYTTVSATGPPGSPIRVAHARSVCRALWQQGFLSAGAPGIHRPAQGSVSYPVPPLVVCTMPDGTAAVLPGNALTCAKLGLPSASNP